MMFDRLCCEGEVGMIHTSIAYGYDLGGPGSWRFKGFETGAPLRTPWYDEHDPLNDFAECALTAILSDASGVTPKGERRRKLEAGMPYLFLEAIEVSPPGWTREANGPPMPSSLLPPAGALVLDQPAPVRYVLIAFDSVHDIDQEHAEQHQGYEGDEPDEPRIAHWQTDWDSLLLAAITELGLDIPGLPDWFWYRTGSPES
jgi:hypothetical protein